jgi:hypothetical protein
VFHSAAGVTLQARRALVALVCIFAFALQGYIAQTHIHIAELVKPDIVAVSGADHIADLQRDGPDQKQDDPSKCPYCQVSASVGSALWTTAPVLLVSLIGSVIEPIAAEFIARDAAPSYVWRSRGPPQR